MSKNNISNVITNELINSGVSPDIGSTDVKITDANLVVENGDILVDNYNLLETLKRIEERLALLTPNPELESDWEELKNLGNQYRELEKKILKKERTWELLKK